MTALRALIAIGIAAFWLFLTVPPIFTAPPSAITGLHPTRQHDGVFRTFHVRVDKDSTAYRAGIRTGDALGCFPSTRDRMLLTSDSGEIGYARGTPLTACVHRGNRTFTVSFQAKLGLPLGNAYGSYAMAVLRVFVVLVFYLTGIALVMLRPSLMTWMFYAYCICSAPSYSVEVHGTAYSAWQYAIAYGLTTTTAAIGSAFILMFAILVPSDGIPSGWRGKAFYAAAVLAALDIGFKVVNTWVYPAASQLYYLPDEILTVLTLLLVIARLATMQRSERARFGWAAFAIMFGVIANNMRNVLTGMVEDQIYSTIFAQLTVVMPLVMIYAILRRHVIDIRFAISRTVVYAALTTFVVGGIGVVDWLTSAYLHEARAAMALDAAVTVGVAFAMHRAYRWIESVVDFVLYRRKHDAETYLNRMAKTLLRAKNEATIDRAVVDAPYEKLDLTMAALYRPSGDSFRTSACIGCTGDAAFESDHELVRFLTTEREKLHIADLRTHVAEHFREDGPAPAVAIPLFQGDALLAFAVYGIHRYGTNLDPDELETLEHLCEVAAQAYTGIELTRYRTLITQPPILQPDLI